MPTWVRSGWDKESGSALVSRNSAGPRAWEAPGSLQLPGCVEKSETRMSPAFLSSWPWDTQRPLGGLVIILPLPLITPVCVPEQSDDEGMETQVC